MLLGPGHAPLSYLALWKEALLGVVLVIAFVEVMSAYLRTKNCRFDLIDWLIVALVALGILLTFVLHTPKSVALLGARYDFVPLIAFLVLRRVPWSEWFQKRLVRLLLIVGAVVAALGIVSLFLPISFFVKLGYADLHSLYLPNQPLAPFQQIEGSWLRRIQGTMSGPNQLGMWLLLPLSVVLVLLMQRGGVLEYWSNGVMGTKKIKSGQGEESNIPLFHYSNIRTPFIAFAAFFVVIALFLTFSRAAWIGAAAIVAVALYGALPRRLFRRLVLWGGAAVIVLGIAAALIAPHVFFRLSSSRGHLVRPLEAVQRMIAHPFGTGLGTAGPASNRYNEACVFLRPQDDPSWAKSQPTLCVFLGTTQVQPKDHVCSCPFLPENWYLQIGVELGVLGFVLFVALVVLVLNQLRVESGKLKVGFGTSSHSQLSTINYQLFLFFLAVSIAALFLHAWEDAAVAYSGWILAGVALRVQKTD